MVDHRWRNDPSMDGLSETRGALNGLFYKVCITCSIYMGRLLFFAVHVAYHNRLLTQYMAACSGGPFGEGPGCDFIIASMLFRMFTCSPDFMHYRICQHPINKEYHHPLSSSDI